MKDIQNYIAGFSRFHHQYFGEHGLLEQLKRGQAPKTLLIGCSDSRVSPEIMLDCDPGDLFVIRNVANLVPKYEDNVSQYSITAGLEYAVCNLMVRQIVVLGHSGCGGINALMQGHSPKTDMDYIGKWIRTAYPVRDYVRENYQAFSEAEKTRIAEMASIAFSLDNLMTFPFIRDAVNADTLKVIGWYFDMQSGKLLNLDVKDNVFKPIGIKYFAFSE